MPYDFDTVLDRRNTASLKFDFHEERGKAPDLLPLWVADMDFSLPQEVLDDIKARVQHGVFGYTFTDDEYHRAVHDWFADHYGWETKREWIITTPGVVFAIATAIRAFSAPGEAILIQPPVYYPFAQMARYNGRRIVKAPLSYDDDTYTYSIDFDEFERVVREEQPRVFVLCNPHNPGGLVWTRDELNKMGEICLEHDCIVVSDEIHEDFARPGYEHVVFADIDPRFEAITVTCTSPSKSFNMAGLQISNVFIANEGLRKRYKAEHNATGYGEVGCLGMVAARSVYTKGGPWLEELKEYLEGNLAFMKEYLAEHAPQLVVVEPQSTYLVWVDCKALALSDEQLRELVEDKARLWLDMGTMFGEEGSGFIRFNIACPRSTLAQALKQLADAVQKL